MLSQLGHLYSGSQSNPSDVISSEGLSKSFISFMVYSFSKTHKTVEFSPFKHVSLFLWEFHRVLYFLCWNRFLFKLFHLNLFGLALNNAIKSSLEITSLQRSIKQNPTPYIIKRGIMLQLSAVTKKNSQYIKVKYNSIPLIINENIFIVFIILYALVKL